MPPRVNKSFEVKPKRFIFLYRAEIAVGFCVCAIAAMIFLWVAIFSAPASGTGQEPQHTPSRAFKPERVQAIREMVQSRIDDLEEIFAWRYSDPFAPRQGTSVVPQ